MGEVRLESALGLNEYIRHFATPNRTTAPGAIHVDARYFQDRDSDIYRQAAALEDRQNIPDTTLEMALAIQYTGAIRIRPVEAERILPEGRASDLRLAAATYAKLQEIRFLDPQNRDRIGRYELMIRTLKQRNNITLSEINTTLRSLISSAVDEEFNKISFSMSNDSIRKGYNVVLTRSANNHYILNYEGIYQGQAFQGQLSAQTQEALLSAMRNNTADFNQATIDAVRAQAALIPAVVMERTGTTNQISEAIKNELTAFYINPDRTRFNALRDIHALLNMRTREFHNDPFFIVLHTAYEQVLSELSAPLEAMVSRESLDATVSQQMRGFNQALQTIANRR